MFPQRKNPQSLKILADVPRGSYRGQRREFLTGNTYKTISQMAPTGSTASTPAHSSTRFLESH